jgi:small subunit ribosomal protein S16
MAVALRLKRLGRKNRPFFRICVFDERTRRDGAEIEQLGHYDPLDKKPGKSFVMDDERARHWLSVGAQPSETVASMLKERGIEIPFRKVTRSAKRRSKAAARKPSTKAARK